MFSKSKWYLSREDFPLDKFPPYCSGSGNDNSQIKSHERFFFEEEAEVI